MSETVHYRGIAKKVDLGSLTNEEFAKKELENRGESKKDYYKSYLEQLVDSYYRHFFFHEKTQTLYIIENNEYEPDEDIIRANLKENGEIEYELRYYNGGAGFDECLQEAFDKM